MPDRRDCTASGNCRGCPSVRRGMLGHPGGPRCDYRTGQGSERNGSPTIYSALSKVAHIAVLRHSGGIAGHTLVRDFGSGKVVGPVVASSIGAAQTLISFAMSEHAGTFLRVDTGRHTGLGAWLAQCGLPEEGCGILMQAGTDRSGPVGLVSVFTLAAQALG